MIKRKWIRSLSDYSIRQQLFIIYLPIIFLSTLVIGGNLIYDSYKQLKNSYQDLAMTDALRVRSVIFESTNTFKNIAHSMSTDTDLRNLLSHNYQDYGEAIQAINHYTYIDRLQIQETSIHSLKIYTSNTTLANHKNFSLLTDADKKSTWFQQASARSDEFWRLQPSTDSLNRLILYKALPLPLSDKKAILAITMDYNFLRNRINNSNYEDQIYLNSSHLFYSDFLHNLGERPVKVTKDKVDQTQFIEVNNQQLLVASTALSLGNDTDTLYINSIDRLAYANLQSNILKWASLLGLVLFTTFILVLIFANFFVDRVKKLQSAVYHAALEDYEFFGNISGNDEISKISLDFHTIVQKIKKNEEAIYQSQIHEQELLNQQQQMEFSILASQINPHFLFNTLETIRMTALKNQDRTVADSIKLLSKSMRYTLDNEGKKITLLADELQAIEVYAAIQKMRFGDRVNLYYQIDKQIDPTKMVLLPLLIQPLIENAISHGLEGLTRPGKILLQIQKDGETLIITVTDNGGGIPAERLTRLQKDIEQNDLENTKNIGLRNVNNRIKLFYGKEYGMQISSQLNDGTTVRLQIKIMTTSFQ
ncbi:hypothetical protein RU97_GL000548 [Enterococcus canis]|uniref:Histidine kinase domain-containing protein n=1 Tax=Enterococcus canis TaxID=214095 RepID=A0A1L8RKT8_9ENTE|nr:histidine kinase [Enterococcus canis]OJG20315.1 hypothetical protein RU97_GL000548 [Enterococcus canis]